MATRDDDTTRTATSAGAGADRAPAAETGHRPPTLPARFEPLRRLGGGGQGEVWLAIDHALAQHVALKIVPRGPGGPPAGRARREARLGRSLAHPNLVRVFDLVEADDHDIVVMEWVAGGAITDGHGRLPMPVADVIEVGDQLLAALACLHAAGVVHRDVKPSNVLIPEPGRYVLGDLGLVRSPDEASDLTVTSTGVGTPVYVAPEVLDGVPHSPASDLYALGVTLHTLITGERPFHAASLVSMLRAKTSGRPPSPRRDRSDCPRWLDAFVSRLMEARPEDRWPDAMAAMAAWDRRRAPSRRRIRQAVTAGLATVVSIGIVVAALGWWRGRSPDAVAVVAGRVIAYDGRGHEMWSRTEPAAQHAVVADLIGGNGREVAVGCTGSESLDPVRASWVDILDRGGRPRLRFDPGTDFVSTLYPELSNQVLVTRLFARDVYPAGRSELVTVLQHSHWYPSMVSIWSSAPDTQLRRVLVNSGSINDVRFRDVDGDGRDELIAVGLNNPMGYQVFVAIVGTDPGIGTAHSPDNVGGWLRARGSLAGLMAYTVLGPMTAPPSLGPVGPEGIVVRQHDLETRLTPDAVPPLAATVTDPSRRVEFWESLAATCRKVIAGDPGGTAVSEFELGWRDLLQERPRRIASELVIGRSLAAAGDRARAIGRLTAACEDLPEVGDLWLRRGELELIDGRVDAGRSSLSRALTAPEIGRTPFDAVLMLTLDACFRSDEEAFDAVDQAGSGGLINWPESLRTDMLALWHFVREEWRHPALDPRPASSLYPAADVVRGWAALERGSPASQVLEKADGLAANPEIAPLADLLRAIALDRAEREEDALLAARTAVAELRRRGRTSFEAAVWLPLAERVVASVGAGNTTVSSDR